MIPSRDTGLSLPPDRTRGAIAPEPAITPANGLVSTTRPAVAHATVVKGGEHDGLGGLENLVMLYF